MKIKQWAVAAVSVTVAISAVWAYPCSGETTATTTTTTDAATASATTTTRPIMDALQYDIVGDEVTIRSFAWLNESVVTIPDTIEGKPVTRIGEYAFQYCYADEVILPKTVREIGDCSFMGCEYLQSMTIPEECRVIGFSAFEDCYRLSNIVIPETVAEIGYCAFSGTAFIQQITDDCIILGDGILYAYQGSDAVTDVTIPDTAKTISYYAFADQRSIQSITIPDSVTQILDGAFDNCEQLGTIHAPATLANLQQDALVNTKWFQQYQGDFVTLGDILVAYRGDDLEVTVPDSIRIIGHSAFEGNPYITVVHLPASVTEIRKAAFYKCTSLQVVTTADSIVRIDEMAFQFCRTLQFINIGSQLESIGAQAFVSCDALEVLTLPITVTSVGEKALGYQYDISTEAFSKAKEFTLYSNADAVIKYCKDESVAVEPYADEVTMTTPQITTTTTTTLSTARDAATVAHHKNQLIPLGIGGILILGASVLIALCVRRKKAKS